jgi:hypothetical protein
VQELTVPAADCEAIQQAAEQAREQAGTYVLIVLAFTVRSLQSM